MAGVLFLFLRLNERRLYTRFRNLPERNVLGEVHTFIQFYFFHFELVI